MVRLLREEAEDENEDKQEKEEDAETSLNTSRFCESFYLHQHNKQVLSWGRGKAVPGAYLDARPHRKVV